MIGIYIVGGYPDIKTSLEAGDILKRYNIDFIELGIPFSEPMADGPVIVEASTQVINQGTTHEEILQAFKKEAHNLPSQIYVMTYTNIIYKPSPKSFSEKYSFLDGLILPDTPNREKDFLVSRGLTLPVIPFVTLESTDEHIESLKDYDSDFIYFISIRGVTGKSVDLKSEELINSINKVKRITGKKVIIGFGIKTRQNVIDANKIADGCIIGTEAVKRQADLVEFEKYIKSITE